MSEAGNTANTNTEMATQEEDLQASASAPVASGPNQPGVVGEPGAPALANQNDAEEAKSDSGMDLGEDGQAVHAKQVRGNYDLPNYGTKLVSPVAAPTLDPPTCLKDLFRDYKQYKMLAKKDDLESN